MRDSSCIREELRDIERALKLHPSERGIEHTALRWQCTLLRRDRRQHPPPVDIRQETSHSFRRPTGAPLAPDPMPPRDTASDVLQGTLDLLVLKTLALEPMHGWGIAQRIGELSQDALDVGQGSVYPALVRLENRALVTSGWGVSDNNRKARFYRLTALGQRALKAKTVEWRRYAQAVELILRAT